MDQLIFASLSHTHYWYEMGMLKVPDIHTSYEVHSTCILYSRVWINRVRLPILLVVGRVNRENDYPPVPVRA